jgi:DNA invertase Pin-like site-specific DNA recombinase
VYGRHIGKCSVRSRTRPLALAYVRVSTTEQAEDGASLTAQRDALTAEAARRGWDVEVVADEGHSAKSVDARPGLVSALDRLDAGEADTLLVVRVDRLSRSVADFAGLMARAKRRGWSLVALDLGVDTSTPAGDLMANVLASVAQYERLVIGQRTREGMAVRRAEGVHLGRARSLPDNVVAGIVQDRAAGLGPTAIARRLNDRGVPTAHGGTEWRASSVAAVLRSTAAQQLAQQSVGPVFPPRADQPAATGIRPHPPRG